MRLRSYHLPYCTQSFSGLFLSVYEQIFKDVGVESELLLKPVMEAGSAFNSVDVSFVLLLDFIAQEI